MSNAFIDVKLDINDDVFVYIINSDRIQEKMVIYEVYKNHEGGVPILNDYAVWFEGVGMLRHSDLDKYMRRQSLQVRVPCSVVDIADQNSNKLMFRGFT